MSLAFSPPPPPSGWSTIPLTVGVAMAETVDCSLKWPNDLVRDDAKLGGILVEASGDVVVAGVGLNLFWAEPMEGACALFETDPGPAVGAGIARSWAGTTLALLAGDHWPRERYRARCTTLGRDIAWDGGRGRAADVACDGALEVDVDGERRSLRSGAVRHVRMR
jgi:BirA family biotin operon repressor/biotin-[acetyl-CoA-carboxylase] ligase